MEYLRGIIQSNNSSITSTDNIQIVGTRVGLSVYPDQNKRSGMGSAPPGFEFYNNFEKDCKARKGIIVINNKDNLSHPRAIVVGNAHAKSDPQKQLIRKDRKNRQTLKIHKLMTKARVQISETGAGIPELDKFQNHLKKYKITVYNYNTKGRKVYFEGPNAQYKINLLYHDGHYNVITSLTAAFSCKFYCEACHTPYNHRCSHTC